ncbi:MAG: zinc ribbon domain-containing protein [Acidobacteriota bacterium]|nr:zinc ribbon domain-containing protein [Acidobacteriota bacterium]
MPIYEYECKECGKVFEAFQKITDKPLARCKFCQGKVEQLISHSNFQLKGSGWYLTDYAKRSASPTSESPGGDGAGKAPEKPADAKAEAAPKSPEKAVASA